MKIMYYEYYPHYRGTLKASIKIDEMMFAMMQTLIADVRDPNLDDDAAEEPFDELLDALETAHPNTTIFALSDALVNGEWFGMKGSNQPTNEPPARQRIDKVIKKINRALATKGFFAGEWEEGSFYFCVKGKEKAARSALLAIEHKHFDG